MKPSKLFRRWQRRSARLLEALVEGLRDCRQKGEVEQIHDLRVTLRRLRLYVRLGRGIHPPNTLAELRRWARGIAQTTGHVRDFDVALEWLSAQPAGQTLAAHLAQRRARVWDRWRRRLPRFPGSVRRALTQPKPGRKLATRLARRFAKRRQRLQTAIRDLMPAFFELPPLARHNFRRTLRWWRYLRELELSVREQKRDALLEALIRVQEALGEYQNRAITLALLERLKRKPSAASLPGQLILEQREWLDQTAQAFKRLAKQQGWQD